MNKSTIIDVREPAEFATSHAEGAINAPLSGLLKGQLPELDKNKPVVVYCNSGNRSAYAKRLLEHNGFQDVTNGINQPAVESQDR